MSNFKQEERDRFFMDIADLFAERSHCVALQVGAVCVKDNRIIATGINGTPTGYPVNCDDMFDKDNWCQSEKDLHHEWGSLHEIHAEMNIILYAAKYGIELNGSTLYSNIEPCIHCTKNLMQSGIVRIIYREEYYRNQNNEELQKFIKENNSKIIFEKLK